MELWVGTWVPEDVIDRETKRLAEDPAASVEEDRSGSGHRDE